MARVLAVSSFVARGSVGLRAIVPALHALGHEATAIPSIMLSNHLSYRNAARLDVPPSTLTDIAKALEANGWLARIDAVLTGYLPTIGHVTAAREIVEAVKAVNPSVLFVCDPVLGDDPGGLYIDAAAAAGVRDTLVPLADALTPNRFELAWLSGGDVVSPRTATAAAIALTRVAVAVTSVPTEPDHLANVLVTAGGALTCAVPRRDWVPHGTGDLFAALFLGKALTKLPTSFGAQTLGAAVAGVEAVLTSGAAPMYELDMAAAGPAIRASSPLPTISLGS